MQKSHSNQQAMNAHRQVRTSTTLNRKYVKRPTKSTDDVVVKIERSPQVKHFYTPAVETQQTAAQVAKQAAKQATKQAAEEAMQPAMAHPMQARVNSRMQTRRGAGKATQQNTAQVSARQLKDQAIQKALADAEKVNKTTAKTKAVEAEESAKLDFKSRFTVPRIALALSCAMAAVFAIVYFVNLNMPDISLKVAAMQSGFDASYPSYVPRDFNLNGITSESSKIVLSFRNSTNGYSFTLTEGRSSWDSTALLNNYVKQNLTSDYTLIREQGLAIYSDGKKSVWVSGGMMYVLETTSGTLSKKQICAIATSL